MKARYYSGQKAVYYWLVFFGIMILLVSIVFISVAIFSEPEAIEQCTTDYVGEVTVDCSVYDKTLMIIIVPVLLVGLIEIVAIYHSIIWALEFWKRKSLADCIGEHAANLYVDLSRDVKILKSEKYDEQTKEMIFGKIVVSLSGISPYITAEEGGPVQDLGALVMDSDTPKQKAVEAYNFVASVIEPVFSEHKGKIREEKAAIKKAELDLALANKQLEIQQQTPQIIVQQSPQQITAQKSPGLARSILRGSGKLLAANYRWTQAAQATQKKGRRYYCTKCKRLQDFARGGPHYCCGKSMIPK
jgi:hypothetical protein